MLHHRDPSDDGGDPERDASEYDHEMPMTDQHIQRYYDRGFIIHYYPAAKYPHGWTTRKSEDFMARDLWGNAAHLKFR